VVESHSGTILENDQDLEYCVATEQKPLIVYAPKDIDYA
jgi:hypothetical protein